MLEINYQLALPIAKKDAFINIHEGKINKSGKSICKHKFFTPDKGYLFRKEFNIWLKENGITEQDWYDKYYLNILLPSQRPRCKYSKCNLEANYRGLRYGNVCKEFMNSHSEYIKYEGEDSQKIRDNLSKSHIGNQKFLDAIHKASKRPEVKANRSRAAKIRSNTPHGKEVARMISRKFWDKEDSRKRKSEERKRKFREDKEFRDHMFSVLPNNYKRSKKCYVHTSKCSNSDKNGYIEYDSSYELSRIMEYEIDPNVVSYIREPRNLDISYEINGGTHWYWPDFIVTYSDGSVFMDEVKHSDMVNEEILLKKDVAEKYYKDNNMIYRMIFEDTVFNVVSNGESSEYHNYNMSLKKGYKSTNEKIIEMLNNI